MTERLSGQSDESFRFWNTAADKSEFRRLRPISASGTFETCQPTVAKYVSEGRPEVMGSLPNDAF